MGVINYSEFQTLASCEWKWGFAYLLQAEEGGERRGLHLGTLLHLGADRWLQGLGFTLPEEWTDDINTGGKPGEERTLRLDSFDPELVSRARWLGARYEAHYGSVPPADWSIISTEEWLSGYFGGYRLVGRTDGLIRIEGKLWLREVKSAANIRQRLKSVGIEPQPTIYYDLVEQNYGERPFGILYDGIHTYQWVPKRRTLTEIVDEIKSSPHVIGNANDIKLAAKQIQANEPGIERDPSESFERVFLDRSEEQIQLTRNALLAAIERRQKLTPRIMPAQPEWALYDMIPNVGSACNSCGFQQRCWALMSGLDESDIEIEDEGDEPV